MYQTSVNDINEFLVRDALRELGEVTRADLGQRLGLSSASVSRIVRRLAEGGEVSLSADPEASGRGRPSEIVRFNFGAAAVIAIDLGGTKCHGVLADLGATTVAEDFRATQTAGGAEETLVASVVALRKAAAERKLPVRAVVVGIPAVPDPKTGLVGSGPNVEWEGYDLIGLLAEHLDEPYRIENDVTLAAIGQAWRGEGRASDGFVTLSIGTGIGAAAFANGRVLRGRNNAAGEVGSLMMNREQLHDRPGKVSGLEAVASGPAVARRAKELLAAGGSSSLVLKRLTAADVFEAANAGDALASDVIDELLDYVAMAVVDLAAVLDPERIILDGSVGRALEPYADAISERVGRRLAHVPSLRFSRLGPNATVIGAIAGALALDRELEARQAVAAIPDGGLRALATLPLYGNRGGDPDDQGSGAENVP